MAIGTVRNYAKAIKPFYEMADISVAWHKIMRGLPRGRLYAEDRAVLQDCIKRAGLSKRVWFYLFRHTRGTYASTRLNSQQLCALMGWQQGSKMPSVYIHLAADDVNHAQAILNGIPVSNRGLIGVI